MACGKILSAHVHIFKKVLNEKKKIIENVVNIQHGILGLSISVLIIYYYDFLMMINCEIIMSIYHKLCDI